MTYCIQQPVLFCINVVIKTEAHFVDLPNVLTEANLCTRKTQQVKPRKDTNFDITESKSTVI